ncbi:hypothetical protein [Streptomyces sp. NPDC004250]
MSGDVPSLVGAALAAYAFCALLIKWCLDADPREPQPPRQQPRHRKPRP